MKQAEHDEPHSASVVDIGGVDTGAPLLRAFEHKDGACAEQHGEDATHLSVPEGHGDKPGCEINALRAAVSRWAHVGCKRHSEGDDVEEKDS